MDFVQLQVEYFLYHEPSFDPIMVKHFHFFLRVVSRSHKFLKTKILS